MLFIESDTGFEILKHENIFTSLPNRAIENTAKQREEFSARFQFETSAVQEDIHVYLNIGYLDVLSQEGIKSNLPPVFHFLTFARLKFISCAC